MGYYGWYSDDYKEGQKDYERRGRPDYVRDRHFGSEADEAYFKGFDEAKREEERREEERREEEQYQEEQERQREYERQQQEEYERQQLEDDYNRQQEEEINNG